MSRLRSRVRHVIFESNTPPSRFFDLVLLWAILISVVVVMLDSVESLSEGFHKFLYVLEWILTVLFTIEYILRIWAARRPWNYIFSVYGIIDLLAVLPTYISLILAGTHYLIVIRTMRLLRIFRILKLINFMKEGKILITAIQESRYKLTVFLGFILAVDIIIGTIMYLIEGPESGFTSIPRGIYWAIVTMTTVGFGDITPQTVLGQTLASIVMLLGYTIIAVPTGIVSVSMYKENSKVSVRICENCAKEGHDSDATFCKFCGHPMTTNPSA